VHITAELDIDTMQRIMDSGYSRIPVYGASPDDIVGTVHVKDLIFVDPKVRLLSRARILRH
jgi:metal transporter CNNM